MTRLPDTSKSSSALIDGEWKLLLALLIAAVVVRGLFFTGGIRGSDAFAYAQHAYDIASGNYDLNSIYFFYGFRYFVLLPTALSFLIFGVNDLSACVFPYLFSLLHVVIIYYLGKTAFSKEIGIIAAGLTIIYPLDISSANCVSPDSFIPFLTSLSILCCLLAGKDDVDLWEKRLLYFVSGILVSFAIMSRVSSIFLFFALAIYQLYYKQYAAVLWIAAGMAIPLLAEAIYFFVNTGDPFFEINRITSLSIAKSLREDFDIGLLFYPKNLLGFDLSRLAMFGFTWWFVIGGLAVLGRGEDKKALLIVVCLLIPFFGLEFGFQSLREGILIIKNPNYVSLLSGPAMLVSAYFLFRLSNMIKICFPAQSFGLIAFFIVMLTAMNCYGAYRLAENIKNDAAPYIAVAGELARKPGSTVYVHHFRWPLFLKYFLRYNQAYIFKDLSGLSQKELNDLSDAYVVLNRRYLEADLIGRPVHLFGLYGKYVKDPPPNWNKVLSFSGVPPYNSVVLYYAKPLFQ
jgi:4-amino-4-deoxy-L-arabinose transferase-like glycosyltransferase